MSAIGQNRSLDHLVGAQEELLRDGQPEHLGSLPVNRQMELRWLFDRQGTRLRTPEDLVYVRRGAPIMVGRVLPVAHQSTGLHVFPVKEHGWQPVLEGQLRNLSTLSDEECINQYDNRRSPFLHHGGEANFDLGWS